MGFFCRRKPFPRPKAAFASPRARFVVKRTRFLAREGAPLSTVRGPGPGRPPRSPAGLPRAAAASSDRPAWYRGEVTLLEELASLVRELDAGEVEYALVGGLAVAVWGAPRATQDIDLLVRPEALARALEAADRRGFRLRALPMTFRDGMELQRASKVEGGALLTVDFLLVNPNLEPVWASRQKLSMAGGALWVISRQALIQMKAAAGRPQDAVDIQRLEELDR